MIFRFECDYDDKLDGIEIEAEDAKDAITKLNELGGEFNTDDWQIIFKSI